MAHDSPLTQETFVFAFNDNPAGAESLESQVLATVESCYRLAETHFQRRFERPCLTFNLRGMAAAVAYPARNAIRINHYLLEQNSEDFLDNTIPHEISHLIAYRLHGRRIRPHGTEWATIMRGVFKLQPLRCHHYDVRRNMKVAYHYRCGCPTAHALGTRRHQSAMRGRYYFCRRCRQPLSFSHREGNGDRDTTGLIRGPETTAAGHRK